MDGLTIIGIICAIAVVVILVAYATRRKARMPEGAVPAHTVAPSPPANIREGGDGGAGDR
ncbi:MAG: hypothetical protein JNM30_15410 [Rhodospirillales bacterium]|nr:hypothetical protein [Rhodospirillales bacterium]